MAKKRSTNPTKNESSSTTKSNRSTARRKQSSSSKVGVENLIAAAESLCAAVDRLSFAAPTAHVYNPLRYAGDLHRKYLEMCQPLTCQIVFLGMNPGPWGMAQTGVPFGEIAAVRDFLGVSGHVGSPLDPHPKRPVEGLACQKSEVSGRRLWGLMKERFGTARAFFREHFILNYCPLVFMESSARNRTPDKLPADERRPLDKACDAHLAKTLEILRPRFLVGVGAYAEKCLHRVAPTVDSGFEIHRILHPSPASPAANQDWAGKATRSLEAAGIWPR